MRWYGKIGYANSEIVEDGITEEVFTEREYTGDVIRNNRTFNNNDSVNGKVNISNQISILSDPYIIGNFQNIRYVEFMGTLWCVTNVEVQFPRLLLTLGGVYNGEQA